VLLERPDVVSAHSVNQIFASAAVGAFLEQSSRLIPWRAATPGGIGKAMDYRLDRRTAEHYYNRVEEAIGCGSGNGDKMAGDFDIGHR
jgi:hypothetical protein